VIRAGMVPKKVIPGLTEGYSDEFPIETDGNKRKYNFLGEEIGSDATSEVRWYHSSVDS
jgi:hypothetical protein